MDLTLRPGIWIPGTDVRLYVQSDFPGAGGAPSGPPPGGVPIVETTAVQANGDIPFTLAEAGESYFIAGQLASGEWRYAFVSAPAAGGGLSGGAIDGDLRLNDGDLYLDDPAGARVRLDAPANTKLAVMQSAGVGGAFAAGNDTLAEPAIELSDYNVWADNRWQIDYAGKMGWGDGVAAPDLTLRRNQTGGGKRQLLLDTTAAISELFVQSATGAVGVRDAAVASYSAYLSRYNGVGNSQGALVLGINDDAVIYWGGVGLLANDGGFLFTEHADFAAPAANHAALYSRDNGAGKTQIVVRFPTGAVQVLATEP